MNTAYVRRQLREYLANCLAFELVPSEDTALSVTWYGADPTGKDRTDKDLKDAVLAIYRAELVTARAAAEQLAALESKPRKGTPRGGKSGEAAGRVGAGQQQLTL